MSAQAELDEAEAFIRRALISANGDASPFRRRRKEMRELLVLFLLQEGRDGRAPNRLLRPFFARKVLSPVPIRPLKAMNQPCVS